MAGVQVARRRQVDVVVEVERASERRQVGDDRGAEHRREHQPWVTEPSPGAHDGAAHGRGFYGLICFSRAFEEWLRGSRQRVVFGLLELRIARQHLARDLAPLEQDVAVGQAGDA